MADHDPQSSPPERPFTLADREKLVNLQVQQAVAKAATNPRSANLGVHSADLSMLLHIVAPAIIARAHACDDPSDLPPGTLKSIEVYLRAVREHERLADREQKLDEAASQDRNLKVRRDWR